MGDPRLVDLNFREIVDYGGQPSVEHRRGNPWPCKGYCVSCEESGLLGQIGGRLDLMSHGCDSDDFTKILGPMPPCEDGHGAIEQPVLFLLEEPGGKSGKDYGVSERVPFRGFFKRPPVWQYFWSPNGQDWPTRIAEFDGNFYGAYFAYLMGRHQLRNVYITNLTKCKWIQDTNDRGGSGDKSRLVSHCADLYLAQEARIFAPRIAFCFGRNAERGMRDLCARAGISCRVEYLIHPSRIRNFSQTVGSSPQEEVQKNDDFITQALAKAGLFDAGPHTASAKPRDAFQRWPQGVGQEARRSK